MAAGKPASDRCRLQVPVKQTAAQLMKKEPDVPAVGATNQGNTKGPSRSSP